MRSQRPSAHHTDSAIQRKDSSYSLCSWVSPCSSYSSPSSVPGLPVKDISRKCCWWRVRTQSALGSFSRESQSEELNLLCANLSWRCTETIHACHLA
mmetsp:Transcript_75770/g.209076  ORF Transcript_75770/g.209076 Transcript_75770/m.209076 type:complete len:97 (-) Transcript_75770:548-838(-)